MIFFLKKFFMFFVAFILIVFTIYFFITFRGGPHKVDKKIFLFDSFSKKHDRINLILGSSLARNAIDPSIFGPNWFVFTNPSQHINDSKLFLKNHVYDKKIDSLIVVINPFDFSNVSPLFQGNERINYLFSDSTLVKNSYGFYKMKFQKLLNEYFFEYDQIIQYVKVLNKQNTNKILENGYLDTKWKTNDLNNLKKNQINYFTSLPADPFYKDIPSSLNKVYIKNFIKEAQPIAKNIIIVITPKSKYFNTYVNKEYAVVHSQMIAYLKSLGFSFFDYSDFIETNSSYYTDNVHLSNDGIQYFSKVLKKVLTQ